MPIDPPAEPWHSFLKDVNTALRTPVTLICFGGFVTTTLYGLARHTEDIDCLEVRPIDEAAYLIDIAGIGSPLHKQHGVYIQDVAFVTYPDCYEDRLRPMFAGVYSSIDLYGLDPYDLALSKLERNDETDRQDVGYLVKSVPLDAEILRVRYREEMRPYLAREEREDLTLKLWLEEFFPPPGAIEPQR